MWPSSPLVQQSVTGVVPTAKAEVDTTNKRQGLINHHHLLVVGPEVDPRLDVIGVAEDLGRQTQTSITPFSVRGLYLQSQSHLVNPLYSRVGVCRLIHKPHFNPL